MVGQASAPEISAQTHMAKPKDHALSDAWKEAFRAGYNVTVQDAVAELRISERTIRRYMDSGSLRHTKVGTRILLHGADVGAMKRTIYLATKAREEGKSAAKMARGNQ